jgi:hypothetical protein
MCADFACFAQNQPRDLGILRGQCGKLRLAYAGSRTTTAK